MLEDEIAGTKDAPLAVVGARAVRVAVRQARRLRGTTEEEAGRAHVADAPAAIAGGKLHEGLALAERDIEIADRGAMNGFQSENSRRSGLNFCGRAGRGIELARRSTRFVNPRR